MSHYPFRVDQRGYLVPSSEEALEAFRALKQGRDVMVAIKVARNPRHHKLLFALLNFVRLHAVNRDTHESLFDTATIDMILTALKIATGHVEIYTDTATGGTVAVPKSIAFESLDQVAFSRFFNAAIETITTRWLPPGTVAEDVRLHIEDMVYGQYRRQVA